ncbi:putative gamma-glutamylcyclotransferase, AIG2, gamma-glutamyl cyclotransferase-like superfamily [Helianthus annuus]|nr:putative gamma-glutamylcyclotransferase, AIG2, gamma-glutamyl cyclotransferase-like superfamily [Helianthus annuus]
MIFIVNHRFSIKGRDYPAILPVENKKVTGRVCSLSSSYTLFYHFLAWENGLVDGSGQNRSFLSTWVQETIGMTNLHQIHLWISHVLTGLSATELDILDMYEDDKYDKRVVDVSLLDASEVLQAYAYVWGNSTDPDLYGEWDFEEFKESKLKDYLERTKNYVKELEDTETSLP